MSAVPHPLRVGIAGFGSIGQAIAKKIDAGIPGLQLTALGVRDTDKARRAYAFAVPPVYTDVDHLLDHSDIVVECAPAALLPRIAKPMLNAGTNLLQR